MKKIAILDTDFLIKTQLAQNSAKQPLADLVMGFAEYQFFCHEKITQELLYHSTQAGAWLTSQMNAGNVQCYTDSDIISELTTQVGLGMAPSLYYDMLKQSCDAFNLSFFGKHFSPLTKLPNGVGVHAFLNTLSTCDAAIPNGNSMGEKKSFVLAQMLHFRHSESDEIVVFCSDDSVARQHLTYINGSFKCLSILAVFRKLIRDGASPQAVKEYYDALCQFYRSQNGQTAMKVWNATGHQRIKVDFAKLFGDICADKLELKGTGDLKYK